MEDRLIEEREAAVLCGLDPTYFRNLRRTSHGPRYVRPSPHVTLYRKSDVEAWRDSWLCADPVDQGKSVAETGDE